ncbi:MAG: hypothetical protein RLZZ342_159 [Candidatus Parcubacteria bacterium]|jgi:hypothetical protein
MSDAREHDDYMGWGVPSERFKTIVLWLLVIVGATALPAIIGTMLYGALHPHTHGLFVP